MRAIFRLLTILAMAGAVLAGPSREVRAAAGQVNVTAAKKSKPKKSKPKKTKPKKSKPKKTKPLDPGTSPTFVLGTISTSDPQILDMSGTYTCTGAAKSDPGTTAVVTLSILQDEKGRLAGETVVETSDKETTSFSVTGSLKQAKKGGLSLNIEGGQIVVDKGINLGSHSDDTETGTHLKVSGSWDGSTFPCVVHVDYDGRKYWLDTKLVPVNTARGFTVDDAPIQVKGSKITSTRTVHFPWGDMDVQTQQQNKKGFRFQTKSKAFKLDLRGIVNDDGSVTLTQASVKFGYGSLYLTQVTTAPSQYTIVP